IRQCCPAQRRPPVQSTSVRHSTHRPVGLSHTWSVPQSRESLHGRVLWVPPLDAARPPFDAPAAPESAPPPPPVAAASPVRFALRRAGRSSLQERANDKLPSTADKHAPP